MLLLPVRTFFAFRLDYAHRTTATADAVSGAQPASQRGHLGKESRQHAGKARANQQRSQQAGSAHLCAFPAVYEQRQDDGQVWLSSNLHAASRHGLVTHAQ